jgi:hypothetical protein
VTGFLFCYFNIIFLALFLDPQLTL